ncbi:glycosyltransferase [Halorubrum sp. SP9]|uniref:glycosyltransferase n=1 Tax=Halorubrum sp. SP9 TaxID=1537267 RepID=UPI0010F92617|nr:glycosyltransferase [Halorubrum sp. SP9]TKX68658.1 glycosyltransferase [Halorubrum sp. SP9]
MDTRPPVSILLPTVRWTDACEDVAAQLTPEDELLIIHDNGSDPVAGRDDIPACVQLIAAGSPTACSGKANAIAAGMDAASRDHIVWTDDDFTHPPDWLDTLCADYEEHGPTTELPVFVGQDPLAVLLEPIYALGGTLGTYLGDHAWGGAVMFRRDDLDESALLSDLRQTISDDGLLGEHVSVTPVRRGRRVPIGGTIRQTVERHVRFNQIFATHDPTAAMVSAGLLVAILVGCVTNPLLGVLLTASVAGVYVLFGIRRLSALLTVPAFVVSVPLAAYSFFRDSFVWGGRRYYWRSKFDVEVEGGETN